VKKIGLLSGLDHNNLLVYLKELNDRMVASDKEASLKSVVATWSRGDLQSLIASKEKYRLLKELVYQCDQLKYQGAQVVAFTDPYLNRHCHEIMKHINLHLVSREEVIGRDLVRHRVNKVLFLSDFETSVDTYYEEAYKRYGVTVVMPPLKRVNKMRLDQKKIINGDLSEEDFILGLVGLIESYALQGVTGVIIDHPYIESLMDPGLLSVYVFKSRELHIKALYESIKGVKDY